ncbi:MAG: hypothetical protein D3908_11560, partial [Candidatus Electrothrix sp. AUS4]|nr:hypothetical protein [Candidatus Electrothrix sp. AUS4]
MKLELLGQIGQWIADTGQWLWDHPEVTWSGAGLTGLAVLSFLVSKLFAPRSPSTPDPHTSNTFTCTGSDQNVAQGDRPIGKQVNNYYAAPQPDSSSPDASPLLPPKGDIFLHREEELAWLDKHLHPDRVVAICAPGGMGKTALAARAVRKLPPDRFPDPIIFHTFY